MIFRRDTIPNALRALGRLIRGIFFRPEPVIVEPEVQDARLQKCNECEFLVPDCRQCVLCTCFVDVKVLLSTESCPKKRW